MKKFYTAIATALAALMLSACVNLNINPLSEGSSSNWFSSPEEFEMATADMYRPDFYPLMTSHWGDDLANRVNVPVLFNGTLTSENSTIGTWWTNLYKGITRSQRVLANLEKGKSLGIAQSKLDQYEGEAYYYIGFAYGYLAFHWGDVILYKEQVTLQESYTLARSPKADVLKYSYECFDKAAEKLPLTYAGQQRSTKGAAYAMKARIALYNGDYSIAAEAAKKCMDLGEYELEKNYEDIFTTTLSKEWIFYFPGSVALQNYYYYYDNVKKGVPRTAGGLGQMGISYELYFAYRDINGKRIDEAGSLYNPLDPFENRDPRLGKTIIPFATAGNKDVLAGNYNPDKYAWLGYEFSPSPLKYTVKRLSDGKQVTNNDSKGRAEHAIYNGLMVKKFVDETWLENGLAGTNTPQVYMRYGDVLLMYAEAMNELGKCDQAVLDATINKIRERAYNGSGISYPKLTAGDQTYLRREIRNERFVEMALEKLRVEDLYRWHYCEVIFNRPLYYLPRVWSGKTNWSGDESQVSDAFKKILTQWREGNFPVGGTPTFDEYGYADLQYCLDKGWISVAAARTFDKNRDYLWPIPAADRLVNSNLTQNPGW